MGVAPSPCRRPLHRSLPAYGGHRPTEATYWPTSVTTAASTGAAMPYADDALMQWPEVTTSIVKLR